MAEADLDRHQLAGLDSKARGFNRPVEFERVGEGCRAILRYESLVVTTDLCPTQDEALSLLIRLLQADGYRQLRTQRSFRNGVYLGSQELWLEYPDPQPALKPEGLLARVTGWFRSGSANE
jgi:hypothetical protein